MPKKSQKETNSKIINIRINFENRPIEFIEFNVLNVENESTEDFAERVASCLCFAGIEHSGFDVGGV